MRVPMTVTVLLAAAAGCTSAVVKEEYGHVQFAENSGDSILDVRLKQLEKLSAEYPKKPEYPYEMAGVYFQKEDYRKSASSLERAIYIEPGEPKYHYHLGRVYLQMRELEQAEKAFRKAIATMPSNRFTGPRGALGYVLCQEGRWKEALEEYETCARIDPEDPTPLYYIGCIQDRLGNRDRAVQSLGDYIRRGGTTYRTAASRILVDLGAPVPAPAGEAVPDSRPRGRDSAPVAAPVSPLEGPIDRSELGELPR